MMNINPMSLVTLALLGALGGCSQQSVPPMNMAGADVITTDTTNTSAR